MPPTNRPVSYRILLYTSVAGFASGSLNVVTSPIACLNELTHQPFDLAAVAFHATSLKERKALVELCLVVRKNPHSANTLLTCLVAGKHRVLLESLQDAGVAHVMLLESLDDSLAGRLQCFVENRTGAFATDNVLAEICPYIHYVPISRRREILYCRAYRDRLVLGPHLLNLYCETRTFSDCPYYRQPKFAKRPRGQQTRNPWNT